MNSKSSKLFLRLWNCFATFLIVVSTMTPVSVRTTHAQDAPDPRFHVQMVENDVEGHDWPVDFSVTLTIDDPSNGTGNDFSDTQPVIPYDDDPTIGRVHFDDLGGLDLAPAMLVTMTNGTITKTHTVTDVAVTSVDFDADTVSGTGTPGVNLNVQHCNESGCLWRRWATVQLDGTWDVNFSVTGPGSDEQLILDIVPGIIGAALESDEDSDHTDYQWGIRNPTIVAHYDNWIGAEGWALGSTVYMEVDDPSNGTGVDFTDFGEVGPDPNIPDATWIQFYLGTFQLLPGQTIKMWDSPYTATKTMIVSDLVVTSVDLDNDIIAGTTDSTDDIYVFADCNGIGAERRVTPVSGSWLADFSVAGSGPSPYEQVIQDLNYGCSGPIGQSDADDDSTTRHWRTGHPPVVVANLSLNQVYSETWPLGSNVTVTVDDVSNGPGIDYTDSGIVGEAPWGDPDFTWVEFNLEDFILESGDSVTLSGNSITKELVVESLNITSINLDSDKVQGSAAPGVEVSVWARKDVDEWGHRTVIADGFGNWVTDFSVAGPNPGEELVVDIKLGTQTAAARFDGDGDYTEVNKVKKRLTNHSASVQDGWVLESSETSNQGGTMNSGAMTFSLGDSPSNQQYRAILHFNTSSLPDNAVITKVVLKIKKQGLVGTNPFATHGKIAVDIRKGAFSNNAALQLTDFQAAANKNAAGLIANNPQTGSWYFTNLNATAFPFINLTGISQFRLRFQKDDNNDFSADFLKFYSGNAAAANRPVLIIEYYVP